MTAPLYLASSSPRRYDLLRQLGYPCHVVLAPIDERSYPEEAAVPYCQRMALQKAMAALPLASERWPIIGADTIIELDGAILTKPQDQADGLRLLSLLSDRTHHVITAVALIDNQGYCEQCWVQSAVTFRPISTAEMLAYWETSEPHDKAGGYAIQGIGGKFVAHLAGSYSGVVGLPLMETDALLQHYFKGSSAC